MHHNHRVWRSTPVLEREARFIDQSTGPPDIRNLIEKYVGRIELDPIIENTVNDALRQPGSFYTFNGKNIIIVVPSAQRAFFAYSG